jgi:ABC-type arginine/histidine transport system permease subunit
MPFGVACGSDTTAKNRLCLGKGNESIRAMGFGAISVLAAILIPYHQYAQLLKWSALVLLVLVASMLAAMPIPVTGRSTR